MCKICTYHSTWCIRGKTQTIDLDFYNLLFKDRKEVIDNNTLLAITLLVAQSDPKEKNIMIDLIMNFLN